MKMIRTPSVAGMFYPSSRQKLEEEIKLYLSIAENLFVPKEIFGIVVPHAGYIYSGKTAAYAYKLLKDSHIKRVIIIAPSHRDYFQGVCSFNGDAYRTPLGDVPVDKEFSRKMVESSDLIFEGTIGHKSEHAVEVQIPFLQSVLSDFSIVPLVMGDQRRIVINLLADALSRHMDEETLIVASSDLSHYYSKQQADKLDSAVEDYINRFDHEGLLTGLEKSKCEACGGGPVVTLMKTADLCGKRKSFVLKRTDSGDVSGDNTEVVGYLSAVVYGK